MANVTHQRAAALYDTSGRGRCAPDAARPWLMACATEAWSVAVRGGATCAADRMAGLVFGDTE